MTTTFPITVNCPVCGKMIKTYWYGSIHYWLAPLLDGGSIENPSPTMCEHCGYVSYDFEKKTDVELSFLQTESYISCDGLKEKLDFDRFYTARYRYYILVRRRKDYKERYYSLRQCMHLYGKKIHRELLPDVYSTYLKAMKEELDNKKSEAIATQIFYLRLMGKFDEAKAILCNINYTDLEDRGNRRLLFEEEMINQKNTEVQDYDDYRKWEIPYLIDMYGDEFDEGVRAVVGNEVPLLYHDDINGKNWLDVAYNYLNTVKADSKDAEICQLLSNLGRALYKMNDEQLGDNKKEMFRLLRFYYYDLLNKRGICIPLDYAVVTIRVNHISKEL